VTYCSKLHQKLDWKYHKIVCKSSNNTSPSSVIVRSKAFLFPESEIVIEPEELSKPQSNKTNDSSENTSGAPSFTNKDLKNVDEKEFEQFCENIDDKTFQKFQTRIKHNQDQVIRYNRGGEPLLCSNTAIPKSIPVCQSCGAERSFEFQIMPQLLMHLDVDSSIEGPTIDWGTLLVYSCTGDCNTSGYTQEFVWRQNFATKEKV